MSSPDETKNITIPREYRGNMMVIKFSYDFEVIVPIDIGGQIISLLSNAEMFSSRYKEEEMVKPMDKELAIRLLAATEYEKLKLSFILHGGKDGND